jgi:acetylornithine aminotransferase
VLDEFPAYPTAELYARCERLREQGRAVFDFGVGDPVEPLPDFLREAMVHAIPTASGYPTWADGAPVREAIVGYLSRRFGVTLDPETQVLPTLGSKEAVFSLPLALIDRDAPDRTVVFPDPGYPAYARGARFAGADVHPVALSGDFKMRPWELPESVLDAARLLWINSPGNPTGAVLDRDHLRRVWEICQAHDILLVSDECYADLHDGDPPPSVLEVATDDVLVLNSLSKRNGMTGHRAGFLAGDPAWVARLRRFRTNPGVAPQSFVNAAAAAAWADDAHAERRRRTFAQRKALLRSFFAEIGLEVVASDATLYVWVKAPDGKSGVDYVRELLELGIVASPGAWLGQTDAGRDHVRFAVCPTLDEIEAAIAAWRSALHDPAWESPP